MNKLSTNENMDRCLEENPWVENFCHFYGGKIKETIDKTVVKYTEDDHNEEGKDILTFLIFSAMNQNKSFKCQ